MTIPTRLRRQGASLSRRRAGHRGDGERPAASPAASCVEANMGAIGAIMTYGSEAQKRLAADLVLSGDKPAICITEPGAGSAATEMTTRADRKRQPLRDQRQEALDHRRRRLAPASDLRPRVRRTARSRASAASSRSATRRDAKGLVIGTREPAMGAARHPRDGDPASRTWRCRRRAGRCRRAGCARASPV